MLGGYKGDYDGQSPGADLAGPSQAANRVCRGGCWYDVPLNARAARRSGNAPENRYDSLGFRGARVQSGPFSGKTGPGGEVEPGAEAARDKALLSTACPGLEDSGSRSPRERVTMNDRPKRLPVADQIRKGLEEVISNRVDPPHFPRNWCGRTGRIDEGEKSRALKNRPDGGKSPERRTGMASTLVPTITPDNVISFEINPGTLLQFLETRAEGGPRLKCFEGSVTLVSPGDPTSRWGGGSTT